MNLETARPRNLLEQPSEGRCQSEIVQHRGSQQHCKTIGQCQSQVNTNCLQSACNQTSIRFGLTVPENGSAAKEHAGRVREMFATIAKRYDLLNHVLSGNVDKRWRRIVATRVRDRLSSSSARILDVACGTGDLSLTLFEITGAGVVGTDFCRPMLDIAAGKTSGRIR